MVEQRRWRLGAFVGVLLAAALAVAAPPTRADGRPAGAGSAALQVSALGRSAIPHLSSRLAAIAGHPDGDRAALARRTNTPVSGAGSLQRQPGTGRLLVEIRVARWTAGTIARLRGAGAVVTHRAASLRTVTAAVAPTHLRAVAGAGGVQYVGEVLTPAVNAVCDSTISEGDSILHAVQERANAGVDGTGVTVGILSDSFDKAGTQTAVDAGSDNLPGAGNTCGHTTPVDIRHDDTTDNFVEDEGRAMAQIVHDVAPGAKILFATAEGGPDVFADNIRDLAAHGADIIVDDINYFNEPVYQDGVVAKAVDDVRAMGVAYFSSAANNNITVGGHDVGSYEAVDGYRPTPCPAAITTHDPNYTDCHSFNASGADPTDVISTAASRGMNITLDWAEPAFGVDTDYDLCILQPNGSFAFCGQDRNPNSGSQLAFELVGLTTASIASSFQVVVARFGGNNPNNNGTPRFKIIFQTNGDGAITNAEYSTPTGTDVLGPTTYGHNAAPGAMTVAASDVRQTSPSTVESYSSHGPATLLFGPVDGTTPADPLDTAQVLDKPEITATDCGINTFFGFNDGTHWRFCGTSAAAPHAAGVAALLLQQNPDLTPGQINTALTSTAVDLGLPAAMQGAGMIDAAAAGAAAPDRQTITFASQPNGAVGGSRTLHATASSGLAVTFKVDLATSPSGACTLSGTHNATVQFAKAGSCVIDARQPGNADFTAAAQVKRKIVIKPALGISTKSLPAGVVGKKYAATLHASGGNAPFVWTVKSGTLPPGLTLAKSGAISGKPTKRGSFDVTILVTDASVPKAHATKSFTIKITRS